jgi:ribose-phosphate pyrophosphokinase
MSLESRSFDDLAVFSGTAHPELAQRIAECLGTRLGPLKIERFPDGEIFVRVETSVRGKDVFVIQPTCSPVNENFTELLIILDALRRASPARISAIIPYYGYARQDKKVGGREPITARMIADMLTVGGADRMLMVDLHSPQIQGFFDIPVDHLTAVSIICEHLKRRDLSDAVVVSPDAGRINMATEYSNRLGLPVVIIHKRRTGPEQTQVAHVVGDVAGKKPIIIDDMITTGGTMARSVEALLKQGAKPEVLIAATHAVLVGKAIEHMSHPAVKELVVSDTIPIAPEKRMEKIAVVSISPLVAEAIARIHADRSVSEMFG